MTRVPGYAGRILHAELSTGRLWVEEPDESWVRRWLGGSGFGAYILYQEVPPPVDWDAPGNRLIVATGPLAGTAVVGSGTVSVVTKGALTNGATTSQANGFLGAYMKFSGFDAIVLSGRAERWVYLYLHDGTAELRDAEPVMGLDTWELQDAITRQLGKSERALSVFGIGPAGEHGVRFAALAGDRGHVAGHNGTGAVLGAKRVKAIVAERAGARPTTHDVRRLRTCARGVFKALLADPVGLNSSRWGTSMVYPNAIKGGWLPVRNYTTSLFADSDSFLGERYRPKYATARMPCWGCRMNHLHRMTITEGPHSGFSGEEPEYEQWAAWGSQIGNHDVAGALVLSNEVDRLGMETNEAGWVIGWVMECYEKGILTRKDTDGLEMTWGNVEATRAMLRKIARREGIGDLLAEGVKRASESLGRGSQELAIYTGKGNSPRGHDHRGRWIEMLDTCVSDTGTVTIGPPVMQQEQGAPAKFDAFNWEQVAEVAGRHNGRMVFEDCLGTCRFTTRIGLPLLAKAVSAATGWDYSAEEAITTGRRVVNLLRVFNLGCGLGIDKEYPSSRYGSSPSDGPGAGTSVEPHWEQMRARFYELMGWDMGSGRPLPETLRGLGLEELVPNLWPAVDRGKAEGLASG